MRLNSWIEETLYRFEEINHVENCKECVWLPIFIYILYAWKNLDKQIPKEYRFEQAFESESVSLQTIKEFWEALQKGYPYSALFHEALRIFPMFEQIDYIKNNLFSLLHKVERSEKLVPVKELMERIYSSIVRSLDIHLEFASKVIEAKEIYSPFTLIQTLPYHKKETHIFAQSLTEPVLIELAKVLDGIEIDFRYGDPLQEPKFLRGAHRLQTFEAAISFPFLKPYGIHNDLLSDFEREIYKRYIHRTRESIENIIKEDTYYRFAFLERFIGSKLDPKESSAIAIVEAILAQTKRRAFIEVPYSFPSKRSKLVKEFRSYLVESNLLEGVVKIEYSFNQLMQFNSYCFIFNKEKMIENIFFMNIHLKENDNKSVIEQYAQIYKNKEVKENISILISKEDLKKSDYYLLPEFFISNNYRIRAFEKRLQQKFASLVPLESIAQVFRSQKVKETDEGEELVEITASDVIENGYTVSGFKTLRANLKKARRYLLQPGDILINIRGNPEKGKVAIIGELQKPTVASQVFYVVRPLKRDFDTRALYVFFQNPQVQELLQLFSRDQKLQHIPIERLRMMKVPDFTEDEQRKLIERFEQIVTISHEIEKLKSQITRLYDIV